MLVKAMESIVDSYGNEIVSTTVIVSVLIVALIMSVYEFIVYKVVSHRAFYNRSFNICIAILPVFIATIILCLQSNIVITLGTIGALAIVRFRTAIKDPVDMVYILWSIHIGITCGCQLYEVTVLTSVAVTVFLIILNYINIGKSPYVLVFHCDSKSEDEILNIVKEAVKSYRIKSRNYTQKGMDYVIEFSIKEPNILVEKLRETNVEKFSVIEYDDDDVI